MYFGAKFEKALADALRAHARQTRKTDPEVPYVVHPISVALLLATIVKDEDILLAGLLHDTLEDTDLRPETILTKYGAKVLALVREVSEQKSPHASAETQKATWHTRKVDMIARLQKASWEAQLIAFADEFLNLGSLLQNLQELPYSQVSSAFNAPLALHVGLHLYRLEHLWQESHVVKKKCRMLLQEYEHLLRDIGAILEENGEKVIPFDLTASH